MSPRRFDLRTSRSRAPATRQGRKPGLRWLLGAGLLAAAAAFATSLPDERADGGPHLHVHEHGDADLDLRGPQPGTADPATVCRQALSTMFSWRPGTDTSPGAGLQRARDWVSGVLARDTAGAADAPAARAPVEWSAWRRSGDSITATTQIEAVSVDGDHAAVRASVSQLVVHRDGTTTPYRRLTLLAALEHTSLGWRLSSYRSP